MLPRLVASADGLHLGPACHVAVMGEDAAVSRLTLRGVDMGSSPIICSISAYMLGRVSLRELGQEWRSTCDSDMGDIVYGFLLSCSVFKRGSISFTLDLCRLKIPDAFCAQSWFGIISWRFSFPRD